MEDAIHDSGAARVREELALVADQPAGRSIEDEALAAAARGPHLDELGFALRKLLHNDAGMLLIEIDNDLLDRLLQRALFIVPEQDFRSRHTKLEALSAHGLDEDTK